MRQLVPICALLLLVVEGCKQTTLPPAPATSSSIEAHFSPEGGCTEAVVKELEAARQSVLVQAYSFTSTPIAKALVEAHKRGVKVEVLLDKSQETEKYSEADFLVDMGIPTKIDDKHAIAHNKVMVIDGSTLITGSFNFTKAAEESNAENLLVIRSPDLAAQYTANWTTHAAHCEPYANREQGYSERHPTGRADAAPILHGYVASKNSEVFHRTTCELAAKIAPKNLVTYTSRNEAVRAGKKPCSECRP